LLELSLWTAESVNERHTVVIVRLSDDAPVLRDGVVHGGVVVAQRASRLPHLDERVPVEIVVGEDEVVEVRTKTGTALDRYPVTAIIMYLLQVSRRIFLEN